MWRILAGTLLFAFGSTCVYSRALIFSPTPPAVQSVDSARVNAIQAALQRPVSWEFTELPLRDLPKFLERELQIPVAIDDGVLETLPEGTGALLECGAHGTSAQAALWHALTPHKLGWRIESEHLILTTKELARSVLLVRIYPVADLVLCYDKEGETEDYDSLIEAIITTVEPNSWEQNGTGEGRIAPFSGSSSLVITQASDIHHDIEALLAALRAARREQGMSGRFSVSTSLYRAQVNAGGGIGGGGCFF
ncbi:MAG TPA: hypothetical protein VL096_04020 [Pirellulaceae bacterium]|nr:hypothetical protein [Pirellulaceae bacterium]